MPFTPEQKRKHYLDNREYRIAQAKAYGKAHPDVTAKANARKRKAYIRGAEDPYIRTLLARQGFPKEAITPELIELKRLTIKTERLCRQLKNS